MKKVVKFKNSFTIMDELRGFKKELDEITISFMGDIGAGGLDKSHIFSLLIETVTSNNVPLSEKKFAADILTQHSEVYRFCNAVYEEWGEANKLKAGADY
jgi:hypothetical protein